MFVFVFQQEQEADALKRKIALMESDMEQVETDRDNVVEKKKVLETDYEDLKRENVKLKREMEVLESKLPNIIIRGPDNIVCKYFCVLYSMHTVTPK